MPGFQQAQDPDQTVYFDTTERTITVRLPFNDEYNSQSMKNLVSFIGTLLDYNGQEYAQVTGTRAQIDTFSLAFDEVNRHLLEFRISSTQFMMIHDMDSVYDS